MEKIGFHLLSKLQVFPQDGSIPGSLAPHADVLFSSTSSPPARGERIHKICNAGVPSHYTVGKGLGLLEMTVLLWHAIYLRSHPNPIMGCEPKWKTNDVCQKRFYPSVVEVSIGKRNTGDNRDCSGRKVGNCTGTEPLLCLGKSVTIICT